MKLKTIGCTIRRFGALTALLMVLGNCTAIFGETRLTATSNGPTTLEIRFENDQQIGGLQFILRSSQDVTLLEIHRSGRTAKGSWMVANNRLNDSTLSVVIVSSDMSFLAAGAGILAEVTIARQSIPGTVSVVSFESVVAANPQAQLVAVTASALVLNSQDSPSAFSSSDVSLGQNYPNPFNPSTQIRYELKRGTEVHLSVFDITGREISRLVDQYQNEGSYTVTWNSSENRWGQLASGTYFVRLQAGSIVATRKMLLTK
jgi:hypothetical protein